MAKQMRLLTSMPRTPMQDVLYQICTQADINSYNVRMCVAAQVGANSAIRYQELQLSPSLADDFREIINHHFEDLREAIEAEELDVLEFASGTKLDDSEVEHVDISSQERVLKQIEPLALSKKIEPYMEDSHFIEGLKYYVISMLRPGLPPVHCFRIYTEANVLEKKWRAMFRFPGTSYYDVCDDPGLLFDGAIDCICYGSNLFILNKDKFLRIFQYYEQIQEDARAVLESLQTTLPIANKDALIEACQRDHRLATRVADLAGQPHVQKLSMARIKRAISRYGLRVRTTHVNGTEQLIFEARSRWEFVWLLSDAYLTSPMTAVNYRAPLKRALKSKSTRAAARPNLEIVAPQPADALP